MSARVLIAIATLSVAGCQLRGAADCIAPGADEQKEEGEGYRVVTYGSDKVRGVWWFDGHFRFVEPQVLAGPVGKTTWLYDSRWVHGAWLEGVGTLSRPVVDALGRRRGLIAYRDDGSWITALDVDHDAVADIVEARVSKETSHLFTNGPGRQALIDWMQAGRHPLCVDGVDPSQVSLERGMVRGCRDEDAQDPEDGDGGGAPTPPGDERPVDPMDLVCNGLGDHPARVDGGIRANDSSGGRMPAPMTDKEWRELIEELAEERDKPKDPPDPPEETDPLHPDNPDNMYRRAGLDPADESYPYEPEEEQNYYSPMNPYGPAYDPEWNPYDDPPPPDPRYESNTSPRPAGPDQVPSEALVQLCLHRKHNENANLREQLLETVTENCTDPAGQPDPDGRVGSRCGDRFEVQPVEDVLELVGSASCQDYEPTSECETTIEDELRRRWRAVEGFEAVEICNPLICREQ